MFERIEVPIPGREYPIFVGAGVLAQAGSRLAALGRRGRVLLVTNPTVAEWYLAPLRRNLAAAGLDVHTALVPDGEEHKSLDQAAVLYEHAAAAGLDRTDAIAALGGGVIGDLAGFVAATYLRGVAFVQVPTTVLAQIDSSIGGKVAVNLPAGKNLVGAFHQPILVLSDVSVLRTLPARELRAGLAEMLKHGLLDREYFDWYEHNLPALAAGDEATLAKGIAWSCRIKAAVVAADEREQGARTLLNLGHTVGHAVERAAGYGTWRHGEAVGIGLLAAGRLAKNLGMLKTPELARLEAAVRATLGPCLPNLALELLEPMLAALFHDKKTIAGRLRFVLPRGLGRAEVVETVTMEMVREELEGLLRPEHGK
ncbi:MAG: 3-dehydroquinate synthase [Bacteroidota bacterium]